MNQTENIDGAPGARNAENEVALVDVLIVLAKNKRLLMVTPILFALVAGLIALAMPHKFTAVVKLLPPQQAQSGAAALLSQLGGLGSVASAAAGMKSPNDLYIGMLRSRTLGDEIIKQFDLQTVYAEESMEKTRKQLESNSDIVNGKDGLITVSVQDKDKKRVAKIANAYVTELMEMTRTLAVTEASQRRLFFERELEKAKNSLASAETELKQAMSVSGVISVDAESRAIVETVGRLRAQISAKEIELGAMRAFVTNNNPEYKRTEENLASLKSELSKLENGRNDTSLGTPDGGDKATGLKNIKILRDVKYHEMLYEILAKQYEAARLDEAKDSSVIQILDPAIEPERKSSPKVVLVAALAGVAGAFLAIMIILLQQARQSLMLQPEGQAKIAALRSHLSLR